MKWTTRWKIDVKGKSKFATSNDNHKHTRAAKQEQWIKYINDNERKRKNEWYNSEIEGVGR